MFFAEAEELAAKVTESLRDGDRAELVRAVHTLKGVAGVLGAESVVTLCHHLEDALDDAPIGALREASELLVALVESRGALDARGLDDVIRSLGALKSRPTGRGLELDEALRERLTDAQLRRLEARMAQGDALSERVVRAELETLEAREAEAIAALARGAEVIARSLAPCGEREVELTLLVATPAAGARAREQSVRVSIERLDAWMHAVLELGGVARALSAKGDAAGLSRDLERQLAVLRQGMLEARMVPLARTLGAVAREARRLADMRGVLLRVEVEGADTEVDRALGEALVGPLTHLARNAVDHGLEGPEARRARGKREECTIAIRVRRRGARVELDVEDDGAGVDTGALAKNAVKKGFLSESGVGAMTHAERLALVFVSGLSSRESAGETSGRGVGMDAVRSALHAIGAAVELDSAPGVFTRVRISAPVTLALVPALVVTRAGGRWAIPMSSLAEVVALPEAQGTSRYAVTLSQAELRATVHVERLHGQRDLTVRPLGVGLAGARGVAGVAELDAGALALVMNVAEALEPSPRVERAAHGDRVEVPCFQALSARAGRFMSVQIGAREALLAFEDLREVLAVPSITEVPGTDEAVRGVALWRSRVLTVFEAPRSETSVARGEDARLVVISSPQGQVALLVDRVNGVVRVRERDDASGARETLVWASRAR